MRWKHLLAGRTDQMPRSTVREFLKHAGRPGVISFAGGLPAPELFPIQEVRRATDTVLAKQAAKALQYGQTEGVIELREYLARRCAGDIRSAAGARCAGAGAVGSG